MTTPNLAGRCGQCSAPVSYEPARRAWFDVTGALHACASVVVLVAIGALRAASEALGEVQP